MRNVQFVMTPEAFGFFKIAAYLLVGGFATWLIGRAFAKDDEKDAEWKRKVREAEKDSDG
jgi:hypothetical protein